MPAGMRCWDPSGNILCDITTNMVKFVGELSIGSAYTGSAKSGSVYVPEWATYPNPPFFSRIDGGFNTLDFDALVWVEGATLYWDYPRVDPVFFNGAWINRPHQQLVYGML